MSHKVKLFPRSYQHYFLEVSIEKYRIDQYTHNLYLFDLYLLLIYLCIINKSTNFLIHHIMKTTNFTGLNSVNLSEVVNGLQQLLADFQVYYTNLRGFHWHVKGKDFFVLHEQFEKMYDDTAEKIDEVAERLLMLDTVPAHNFSVYLQSSKIKETGVVSNGNEGLEHVLDSLKHFIASERTILSAASEAGDESTVAMMSDYIKEQEKLTWMLTAYFSK